ncbi:MAG TPA: pyroglutamyl-peptidase I, partial [Rhodanobacteraceae bacterium]|nr:pyroglutamyl-peptidase I [Rhodanobacteraceae bacterium]
MKRTQLQDNILLTGFAPFAGEAVNPSWQAVRALDGEVIEGHRVIALELP